MDQEPLKKPEEVAPAEKKAHKKFPISLPILVSVAVIVVIAGIGGLLFFLNPWQKNGPSQSPYKKSVLINNDKKDLQRTKVISVDPKKEQSLNVYTDKNIIVNIEIPAGVFKEPHKLVVSPYITTDPSNPVKILIYPQDLAFKKPVTITFDLTRSKFKSNAPEFITASGRTTGTSQLLFTDRITDSPVPALISRATETSTVITARILGTGLYSLTTDGKNQKEYARDALANRNSDVLTVLESGSTLVFNKENLSANEKKVIESAIDRIKNKKSVSSYDLYPAFILSQKLAGKELGFSIVKKAEAFMTSNRIHDLMRYSCGSKSESAHSLAITASTARAFGFKEIEQKCMDHARTIIAEKSKKLMAGNPTSDELAAQIRENKSFELPESAIAPLQKKLEEILKKEIEDLIKNEGSSYVELLNKLAEAQVKGGASDELISKAQDALYVKAYQEAKKITNDPNASKQDVARAVAIAELEGLVHTGEKDADLLNDLQKRFNRTPQEVYDSSSSSYEELVVAWQMTDDPVLKEKLFKRKQDIRKKFPSTFPTPTVKSSPTPTPSENGFDETGMFAVLLFEELGGESFTEEGYRDFGKKATDYADEGAVAAKEACASFRDYIEEFEAPEGVADMIRRDCGEGAMASLDQSLADSKIDIEDQARDIGDAQKKYDEFDDDETDWHIEIELTPTPGDEEVTDVSIDEWGEWNVEEDGIDAEQEVDSGSETMESNLSEDNESESYESEDRNTNFNGSMQGQNLESDDSNQEDDQSTFEYDEEDVQGASTSKKKDTLFDSILKFIHLKK